MWNFGQSLCDYIHLQLINEQINDFFYLHVLLQQNCVTLLFPIHFILMLLLTLFALFIIELII